ncbi:MAG: SDR family NAD(P)-dependent oxidoreductase [Cyclobacteriaceae bacterium]
MTGTSSGIGRATTLELAKQGTFLFLVARRKEALGHLAQDCFALAATSPTPSLQPV